MEDIKSTTRHDDERDGARPLSPRSEAIVPPVETT
jgi:hypothetical protein